MGIRTLGFEDAEVSLFTSTLLIMLEGFAEDD